jgi:hypothetical protein
VSEARAERKPPREDALPYSWIWSGEEPNKILCTPDPAGGQTVEASWWELEEPMPFHDETLVQASREINEILSRCQQYASPPEKTLSFILIDARPFLVWSDVRTVGPFDEPDAIAQAFRLRREESQRQ